MRKAQKKFSALHVKSIVVFASGENPPKMRPPRARFVTKSLISYQLKTIPIHLDYNNQTG